VFVAEDLDISITVLHVLLLQNDREYVVGILREARSETISFDSTCQLFLNFMLCVDFMITSQSSHQLVHFQPFYGLKTPCS
jgi:hypothetical protein